MSRPYRTGRRLASHAGKLRASLKKLDAKTRKAFEDYLRDVEQRPTGVIGSQSPECTMYDFVQQRIRPFVVHGELGCCERPLSARATVPPRGRCLMGSRLLISIALYGNDPHSWEYLSTVLHSLAVARFSAGMSRVDVVLDVTHVPPIGRGLSVPHGLNVTHQLHSLDIRKALAGQHRRRAVRALASDSYDYYAYLNNDLNFTAEAFDALCAGQAPLAGTNLMVGPMRYETKRHKGGSLPSRRLLNDLAFPPHLGGVVTVRGQRFLVPTNPHHGAWFLPAGRLRCLLDRLAMSNETHRDWSAVPLPDASLEYYDSLWLMPWLIKVVPLDTYDDLLVHHLSNKYAQMPSIAKGMPEASALREASLSFTGFEPVSLSRSTPRGSHG